MPLATAAWDARAARRVTAAAIAVALQGVFYVLILHETIEKAVQRSPTPLEVTLFETPVRPRPAKLPRSAARRKEAPKAAPSVAPQPITSPQAGKPARHAPIDWQRAIQNGVAAEESPSRPKKLNFGFPQAPQEPKALPQFGWDYARIHRVEPLPHGGTLIHLTDHCVLVIYALLPFPGCEIGRIPANGHLFDDLKGPWNDRTDGLP
jgi:hypothetical protein